MAEVHTSTGQGVRAGFREQILILAVEADTAAGCGMRDLSSPTRKWTRAPAVKVQSLEPLDCQGSPWKLISILIYAVLKSGDLNYLLGLTFWCLLPQPQASSPILCVCVCVCVLTALWRYYVIHIHTIYPLNVYSPVTLNTFTGLYIHHHNQSSH